MKAKPNHKLLVITLALGLLLLLALLYLGKPHHPKLTVIFLTRTTFFGRDVARFAVTNLGDAPAISSQQGRLELDGYGSKIPVACNQKIHRLLPGEGDVITVFMPLGGFQGPWRFECLYSRQSLRSRIYDWQWGPNGPKSRANKFVPKFLKGVPLDVTATSDWIDKDFPNDSPKPTAASP